MRFLTSAAILAVEVGVYWAAWNGYFSQAAGTPFFRRGDWLMVAVYTLMLLFFSRMYGGLKVGYLERGNVLYSQMLSLALANGFAYLQAALLAKGFLPPLPFLLMSAVQAGAACAWTFLAAWLFGRLFPPRRLLLVYGSRPAQPLMGKMGCRRDRYRVQGLVHVDEGLEAVKQAARGYEAVVVCDVPSAMRNRILKHCYGEGKRVYLTPKLSDILVRGAEDINLFDTPLIMVRNGRMPVEQAFLKRAMDIAFAGAACLAALPLAVAAAAAVKLQDGGPVLYRQKRLTIHGREFYVYKFRSMRVDAEGDGVARLASEGDSRVTPVGAFIRRVRLDELPQLFNILKGDMSIVGPRPERPEVAARYEGEMPEFRYRLRVKAGLTGYAQVYGKYNTTPYDKLKMDLHYIQNYSLALDVKLMVQTVKVLFMKASTQGVDGRLDDAAGQEPKNKPKTLPYDGRPFNQHYHASLQCGKDNCRLHKFVLGQSTAAGSSLLLTTAPLTARQPSSKGRQHGCQGHPGPEQQEPGRIRIKEPGVARASGGGSPSSTATTSGGPANWKSSCRHTGKGDVAWSIQEARSLTCGAGSSYTLRCRKASPTMAF